VAVLPDGRFVFVREAGGDQRAASFTVGSFTVVLNEIDRIARERRPQ